MCAGENNGAPRNLAVGSRWRRHARDNDTNAAEQTRIEQSTEFGPAEPGLYARRVRGCFARSTAGGADAAACCKADGVPSTLADFRAAAATALILVRGSG